MGDSSIETFVGGLAKTSSKLNSSSSSFGWANGQPVTFKNAAKALEKAQELASEVLTARDDNIQALVAKKRKAYEEKQSCKKQRAYKTVSDDSLGSTANSDRTASSLTGEDEIEWSDCDESELSRNISILEQSITYGCQTSEKFSPTMRATSNRLSSINSPKRSPARKKVINHQRSNQPDTQKSENLGKSIKLGRQKNNLKEQTSSGDDDDNELEWSDCEADLSRNISLLEQSINS